MSNLNEVLEFIKNSNDKSDLKSIYNAYSIRMSELRQEVKDKFRVGDVVGIDHKKIDPKLNFRVTKINSKNIKVITTKPGPKSEYIVSPGLLVIR